MQDEVALVDQRLHLLDDLLGVARGRQDAAQFLELELEAAHFFAELRELALRGAALFDLLVQLRDLSLGDFDVLVDFADVEIVRGKDQAAREDQPQDQSVV